MIRVASLLTALHIGGDENRLLNQIAASDRSRIHYTVVVVLAPTEESERLGGPMRGRFEEAGIEVVDLGLVPFRLRRSLPRPLAALRTAATGADVVRRVAGLLRARRIDVVDARLWRGALLGAAAGRLAGVGAVVATNYLPQVWRRPGMRPVGDLAYAAIDTVVSDSRARLDEIRRQFRWPPRGALVPNGIAAPAARRTRADMAAELGLPADVPIVGQVARLQPFKGQHLLIRAAPRILERVPDAHFVICGYAQLSSDYRSRLEADIARLGLRDRVRVVSYPGPVGDIWTLIDVHAHPTLLDSSPIAILEGMALGRPVVTTAVGGIPELVADGETGRVLPPDRPDLLAEAVADLLTDPETARRFGRAARARYEARHRPERLADGMEQVFRQALEAPRWPHRRSVAH